ncbi:MAG: anaerobic ribonucleoside-triphosphate reductase activating protein [bacterium]|nr:anaerobic ribonucleoside-triphosphate reductase activating protein [bacterium]
MIIGGLQKTTLIDYPGKVAATVFLAGCNFRCPWCYSSELVLPEKIGKQPRISEEEFFGFLESKKGLLDGLVICGGEPTINSGLPDFIKKIKDMGFLVKLDTNGSNPQVLKDLVNRNLIDYVAVDIKFSDDARNKESVEFLKNSKKIDFEFRTTVVPGIHKKEDFVKIAEQIGGSNVKYYLQSFRAEKTLNPEFENIKPYPDSYLKEIRDEVKNYFKICEIR